MFSIKDHTDKELIIIIRKENKKSRIAFNVLFERYSAQVYGYCLYRSETIEEAEELAQDSWIKFHKSMMDGKDAESALPLLLSIAKNCNVDYYRKKNAVRQAQFYDIGEECLAEFPATIDLEIDLENDELARIVKKTIANLKDIYRDAITLYWFGELDCKEISAIIGENEKCARMRVSRAFEQLAIILKPYFVESSSINQY